MSVRKLVLAALCSSIALATAAPAFADWDGQRHEQQEWRERQERQAWRERQERQAWREHEWREHAWREQQGREQPHGFPFVSPSRNYTPPPLYDGNPGYRR